MIDAQNEIRVAVSRRWPTLVARTVIDGHDGFSADMAALAGAPPDGDVFAAGHPAFTWLKERINAAVSAYFEHHTEIQACSWRLEGRLAVRGANQFEALTNAPGAYLSGVYFATAPARKDGLRLRDDVVTNSVTLLDPRFGMNMNSIGSDPYIGQLRETAAEPGLLMMWPAFVTHWTTPNHSDEPLVAVRFDVVIDEHGGESWQRLAVAAPDAEGLSLKDCFTREWPTYFLRRELDDSAQWNDKLAALVTDMETAQENLTTEYRDVDLFARDDPPIQWLSARINETVQDYLAQFVEFDVKWHIQGWPNINRIGDYHAPHNHCWCYLSGTYYVCLPEAESGDDLGFVPSGAINFTDPRPGINMFALPGDPYSEPHVSLTPAPGTMMMWPASLMHNVYPNMSDEERITLSFNIILEWDNRYLG